MPRHLPPGRDLVQIHYAIRRLALRCRRHKIAYLLPALACIVVLSRSRVHRSNDSISRTTRAYLVITSRLAALYDPIHPPLFYVTDLGWNAPRRPRRPIPSDRPKPNSDDDGLSSCQHTTSARMYEAQLRHSRRTENLTEATYVFADFETCYDVNWPTYGGGGGRAGRSAPSEYLAKGSDRDDCAYSSRRVRGWEYCRRVERVLSTLSRNQLLVLFNCQGHPKRPPCANSQTILSAYSWWNSSSQYYPQWDIGLPAPSINDLFLRVPDWHCHSGGRKYLAVFRGNTRRHSVRKKLLSLDNNKDVIMQHSGALVKDKEEMEVYGELLLNSSFAIVARGDNLFSYRLLEVIAAGCVPVILSDGWTLPLDEIIPWNELAIRIAEKDYARIESVLRRFSREDICQLRRKLRGQYERRLATFDAVLQSHLDLLDTRLQIVTNKLKE